MKKKAKKKAKPSKSKAKKPVKKAAKKPVRKAKPKKKVSKSASKKKSKKAKPAKPAAKAPKIKGTLIGSVTHYFPHVNAAVVKIKKGGLDLGDRIYLKGHTTDFEITVSSMQIDHAPIDSAVKGDEIGMQVPSRVREGDSVYKL